MPCRLDDHDHSLSKNPATMIRSAGYLPVQVVAALLALHCPIDADARRVAPAQKASQGPSFKEHLRRADKHYDAKEYDLAITDWQAAYAIKPVPVLLFVIAQTHELAARPAQALPVYEVFVAKARRGPERKQAKVRVEALRALLGLPPIVEDRSGPAEKAPWFDAGVGLLVGGRSFSFTEQDPPSSVRCYKLSGPDAAGIYGGVPLAGCPRFHSTAVSGLRLDATAFPLARQALPGFLGRLKGRAAVAVRGLGVGATVDLFFWPSSTLQGAMPVSLKTSELRAEVGLRWVFPVVPRLGLLVRAMVQYGLHQFSLQKDPEVIPNPADPSKTLAINDNHGLPDIRYQYLDLGAGVRLPYYGSTRLFLGTVLEFHYHVVLAYGEIASSFADQARQDGGYGPVNTGYGLRIDWVALEAQPFRGVTLRAGLYYERFGLNFKLADGAAGHLLPPNDRVAGDIAQYYAMGATDQYYGGILQAEYQF